MDRPSSPTINNIIANIVRFLGSGTAVGLSDEVNLCLFQDTNS